MNVLSAQGLGKGRGREKRLDSNFAVNYLYLTLGPAWRRLPRSHTEKLAHGVTAIYGM